MDSDTTGWLAGPIKGDCNSLESGVCINYSPMLDTNSLFFFFFFVNITVKTLARLADVEHRSGMNTVKMYLFKK